MKDNKAPKNSFIGTFKEMGKTGKQSGKFAIDKLKELPNLPWKKLPLKGWLILIFTALMMIAIYILGIYFLL